MKQSAGLVVYRVKEGRPEVFLVHPGGPYWAGKDMAAWSIPKGEFEPDEEPLAAARREFVEETGHEVPAGASLPLKPVKQPGGKIVHAWYLRGDPDASVVRSNTFEMEWPPKSGRMVEVPEVDRAAWYGLGEAKLRLHKGLVPIIEQLEQALGLEPAAPTCEDLQRTRD
jgi:predicted NUDIX family NTP pyrophosphohydrolase